MTDITGSYARSRFASRVRNLANSGISWGTNAYPGGSDPGWFGGSTGGIGSVPPFKSGLLDASEVISHYDSYLRLYSRIRRARIYITRARSNYGSYNGPQAIYNGTAIAHLNNNYRPPIAAQGSRTTTWSANTSQSVPVAGSRTTSWTYTDIKGEQTYSTSRGTRYLGSGTVTRTTTYTRNTSRSPLLEAGQLATLASFNNFVEQMRSVYYQASRGSSLVSLHRHICHDSCHSNCHDSRGRR